MIDNEWAFNSCIVEIEYHLSSQQEIILAKFHVQSAIKIYSKSRDRVLKQISWLNKLKSAIGGRAFAICTKFNSNFSSSGYEIK